MLVGVDFGPGTPFRRRRSTNWRCWPSRPATWPVARVIARRKAPDAALFVGSGKADEIKALVPAHRRRRRDVRPGPVARRSSATWSATSACAVADRTMLILEIFARARAEPRRQAAGRTGAAAVPVARGWCGAGRHLERQRGGIGMRGGPGEAQIELDRRMIGERIKRVKARLEQGQAPAQHAAPRARAQRAPSASRWSATPTPASRRCSMRWSRRAPMPPTSCSRRWTRPRASSTSSDAGALGVAVRHGRLHPRPAAQAGRGLRGHAAGGRRCRPAAARGRCGQPAAATSRCAEVERVLRRDRRRPRAAGAGLQQARPARADRSGRAMLRDAIEARRRRAHAARLRQRRATAGPGRAARS